MFTIPVLLEALTNPEKMNISQNRLAKYFDSNASTINGWLRKNIRPQRDSAWIGSCLNECRLDEKSWKNTSAFVEKLIEAMEITPQEKHYLKRKYEEFRRQYPSEKECGRMFLNHVAQLALERRDLGSALEYDPFNLSRPVVGIGIEHIVVAVEDGRVLSAGANDFGQCETLAWRDVAAVSAGWRSSVGLKKDGTCIAVGNRTGGNGELSRWRDLSAVCCGAFHVLGLKLDGTVNAFGVGGEGQCSVAGWDHIRALAAGTSHSAGLREDGTVVAAGSNREGQCEVSGWKNVVQIAAAGEYTAGLTDTGEILFAGNRYIYDFSGWENIRAIAAGTYHIAGLKKDGTVLQTGNRINGLDQVSRWWDMKAVFAGYNATAGIRADGTVLVTQDKAARTYLRGSVINIYGEAPQADSSSSPYEQARRKLIDMLEEVYSTGIGLLPALRTTAGLKGEDARRMAGICRLTEEMMKLREQIIDIRPLADLVLLYGEAYLAFRNTVDFTDGSWYPAGKAEEECVNFLAAVRMFQRDLRSRPGL